MMQLLTRPIAALANLHARHDPPVPEWVLRPFVESHVWTMTHYNVVIADLPEPHRFLACMALLGQTGLEMFDVDEVVTTSPRDTVTLACGTAATAPDTFTAYSARRDCELAPDGSHIRLGDALEITGRFPSYQVTIDRPALRVRLDLECTGQVTWFARSPVYDHIGLPARYRGTLAYAGEETPIAGTCSLEHLRAATPVVVGSLERSPRRVKVPADFFSYQVLDLGDDELLTLAHVEIAATPLMTAAYWTRLDGDKVRFVDGVGLTVREHAAEPAVAPNGETMRMPRAMTWTADGGRDLDVTLTVDTGWIYGVGRGHMGGARFEGHVRGRRVSGRGYVEWVDCRDALHAAHLQDVPPRA